MKNKSNLLLLAALIGGLLFSIIFWEERLALNLLIYSLYLLTITYLNPEVIKSKKINIYGAAHVLAVILVVVNNSDLTLVTYYISLILVVGFGHHQQLRTVFMAFFAFVLQMMTVPFNVIRNLGEVTIGNFNLKPLFKIIKYIFIPAVIVVIFTCLYSAASSVFAHYAEALLVTIGNFFNTVFGFIFKDLSFARFMHFCFGLMVTAGLLMAFFDKSLQEFELKCKEQLSRTRKNMNQKTIWFEFIRIFSGNLLTRKLALKTEFITGLISFSALNLLLLLLNAIDITTLWFGYKPAGNFSADLHDGTNALIFSIALAMAIIIYFFRGNLNFYSKSKTLKILALSWMIQNAILIISVLIRDGYYIEFYGLTHKRIGVLVFALLCIIGLATVYVKVAKQKTFFYLLKVNGAIWFALLLAFSAINWDIFIVKYNLSHSDSISVDADYLLSLSDKTLPVLDKNRSKLEGFLLKRSGKSTYQNELDERVSYFKERYEKVSWVSWNLQDWNTAKYFGIEK
ncbi:DUF4173 domain-containing protein [Pedobacter rhodius]|uniref:DUF4173 domain-containing protein n=1 Tax=Pedobacter rhodius TaxID=3004098 RepID=A0ABT4KX95_9SPHI|nr:DUF4173 domain-containing protein [Pedobacter sp. SJ11]MCZ4223390.1 DUF4173 domain-containing protein [Pedobacter sp. SJ11]